MQIPLPVIFPLPVDLFPAIEILFLKLIPLPVIFHKLIIIVASRIRDFEFQMLGFTILVHYSISRFFLNFPSHPFMGSPRPPKKGNKNFKKISRVRRRRVTSINDLNCGHWVRHWRVRCCTVTLLCLLWTLNFDRIRCAALCRESCANSRQLERLKAACFNWTMPLPKMRRSIPNDSLKLILFVTSASYLIFLFQHHSAYYTIFNRKVNSISLSWRSSDGLFIISDIDSII